MFPSIFKKKKTAEKSESEQLIRARHDRTLQYMTKRDKNTAKETIIAKDGVINIVEDDLVISCGNDIVFRAPVSELKAYELMNLSGINLIYEGESYIAYYTKGIENK
ncbi:MAG: hypothetical protein IJ408_04330 [Clostridia bacterium]|nr:hypothetical protein [Clostridia bacterium]